MSIGGHIGYRQKLGLTFLGLFLIASCCTLMMCHESEYRDAVRPSSGSIASRNEIRRGAGVRPVDPNWYYLGKEHDADVWLERRGGRYCKRTRYGADGELLEDLDIYYSGNQYKDYDGMVLPEELIVTYEYGKCRRTLSYGGRNPAIVHLLSPQFAEDGVLFGARSGGVSTRLSEIELETIILEMWNMRIDSPQSPLVNSTAMKHE